MNSEDRHFLQTCLFFNVNVFSRQLLRLAEEEFKHLNISPAHASLLLMVYERPGISPKALSRLLELNPSTITRFVDALIKKKLVRRQNKGKIKSVVPTRQGKAVQADVAQAYKKLFFRYAGILGPETSMGLSQAIARANERIKTARNDNDTKF